MCLGELVLSLTWGGQFQWLRPISSAATEIHILGLGFAHQNIYPMFGLLDCMKGLVLLKYNHRISMTQGKNIQEEFCSGSSEPDMAEALNQTNGSLQGSFCEWGKLDKRIYRVTHCSSPCYWEKWRAALLRWWRSKVEFLILVLILINKLIN